MSETNGQTERKVTAKQLLNNLKKRGGKMRTDALDVKERLGKFVESYNDGYPNAESAQRALVATRDFANKLQEYLTGQADYLATRDTEETDKAAAKSSGIDKPKATRKPRTPKGTQESKEPANTGDAFNGK